MIRRIPHALLALLAATPAAVAAPGGEGWAADVDKAVATAKAEKKDLFVDFTGSDWCIWCKRLDKEVFAHEAFLTAAKKDFVLVALDYPHSDEAKAKVPNPKRNDELQDKYSIQGFPTILLMNADGVVYGQMGYEQGGPEKYVESLAAARKKGREELTKYQQLVDTWTKASGDAKFTAWDALADALAKDGEESRAASLLIEPVRAGL